MPHDADILAQHRLASIEARTIRMDYPRLVGYNARLGLHGTGRDAQVRVLHTDQGAQGWGLSRSPEVALPQLTGRPLSDLFDADVGVIAPEAAPLDLALHDLAARILGVPVYAMLGGQGPRAHPMYDGAIYMDDLLPPESPRGVAAVLDNCQADHALGYRAFKLKIGRGNRWMDPEAGLARDIEVTRLVREHYPEAKLLVDANDGYTPEGFLRYLEGVADCRLYWIEEPFEEHRQGLLLLREALARLSPDTLVADGERAPDVPMLLELAREGLIQVLLMDIDGFGFTPWRRGMPLIKEAGAWAAPHAWGDPIKSLYAAQLGVGLGNVLTIEGVPGSSPHVDWSAYAFYQGVLTVPDATGFGMTLRP